MGVLDGWVVENLRLVNPIGVSLENSKVLVGVEDCGAWPSSQWRLWRPTQKEDSGGWRKKILLKSVYYERWSWWRTKKKRQRVEVLLP